MLLLLQDKLLCLRQHLLPRLHLVLHSGLEQGLSDLVAELLLGPVAFEELYRQSHFHYAVSQSGTHRR